jgi:RimJ/RimL family protein N-acetyltransferase
MSKLITDQSDRVGKWVAPRAHSPAGYGKAGENYQAVGVENPDGDLVGGMVFENYDKHSVVIHLAIEDPKFVHLSFYKYCFQYAFVWMGCQRMTAMCIDGYERNERLLRGMCFTKEGVLRRGWKLPSGEIVDAALYGCLIEECKLIPKEYRHASPPPASD